MGTTTTTDRIYCYGIDAITGTTTDEGWLPEGTPVRAVEVEDPDDEGDRLVRFEAAVDEGGVRRWCRQQTWLARGATLAMEAVRP